MTPFEILFVAGAIAILPVVLHLATANAPKESYLLAAMLAGAFAAFTAVTVATDGVMPVLANHTANLWGVQVWWDLLIAVLIALVFIVPRARRVGMNVPLWVLAVAATASIALLVMVARLFWLEQRPDVTRQKRQTASSERG